MPILRVPIGGTLPKGRYYVDVYASWVQTFEGWVSKNAPNVKVTSTEVTEGATTLDGTSPTMTLFVFETLADLTWEGPNFPHIIPAGQTVTSTDDIYQVPKVSDVFDQLYQSISGLPGWVPWVGGAAAAALILSTMAAVRRKR
jgi:hypothetical protein